jgi:RimJ/RimL family protein N-acetyltransferase
MTSTEYPVILNQLPLNTRSLLIRQIAIGDARDLFELSNEEIFRAWLPSQVYRDESHARSVLEFLIGQYSTPANPRQGAYVLVIEHKADRTLIGYVGFSPIDDDVEIGFAIAQRYQGHGLAVQAIVAASRWALQTFALDRILGITSSANTASKRALMHAEFAYQGDKVMRFQGTEQSVSVYALLAYSGPEVGA